MTPFQPDGGTAATTTTGSWPWPPEIPPHRPPAPPGEPPGHWPASPAPILPTWEEPDPAWSQKDVADRLLDQRIVLVNGRLDDAMTDVIARQLLLLGSTDLDRPIELHLSCRDAELSASVALATTIDLIRADVHVVVSGMLGGPALAVVCAAAERAAHRRATFVLSLPRESADGTAAELATRAEQHELLVAQLVERISTATGRREEDVAGDLRSGRLLSAEEAAAYGLVDDLR
jgi:ATP-dependent Clp protease protease subunit